jgi:hypothetical protein
MVSISGNGISHSHMEYLYGIFTTEVVAIIRHISETNLRVCGIDWRMK